MKQQGDIYISSDEHIGGMNHKSHELFFNAQNALKAFYKEHSIYIETAVFNGDMIERWNPTKDFKANYSSSEVKKYFLKNIDNIFSGEKKAIVAVAGNHQNEILPVGHTLEQSFEQRQKSIEDYNKFIINALPEAEVDVFDGIKEISRDVFIHHGDYFDIPNVIQDILEKFPDNIPTEEKIIKINENKNIYFELQKIWQEYRKVLWPVIQKFPDIAANMIYPASILWRLKSICKNEKKIMQGRTFNKKWRDPITDFVILDLEILKSLARNTKKSVIIAGHKHVPGFLQTNSGTVVHLGAQDNIAFKPTNVIIKNLSFGNKVLLFNEFHQNLGENGKWVIRNEVKLKS